jgi:hypothetical protein
VVEVPAPGLYLLSIWIRESGVLVDKLVLAKDEAFVPDGLGPAESEEQELRGSKDFIRGDADGDGKVNVTDAVAVLSHLFRGAQVSCEDAADADDGGSVNVTDVVRILSFLFERGTALSQPYPVGGKDMTPDLFPCGDP